MLMTVIKYLFFISDTYSHVLPELDLIFNTYDIWIRTPDNVL